MRYVVLSIILCLCACSSPPSALPEATRIVEVTREVEVTRVVQIVVTATTVPASLPTDTPIPNPVLLVPTATPQPLPDGWTAHPLLNGSTIVAYPSGWTISGEDVGRLKLESSDNQFDVLTVTDLTASEFDVPTNYDELLHFAKVLYLDMVGNTEVTFRRDGQWEIGRLNAYFTANSHDYVYDNTGSVVFAIVADGDKSAIINYFNASSETIPDSLIVTLQEMARNLRL